MIDPLIRLSQEEIERRTRKTCVVIKNLPGIDIEELKKLMNRPTPIKDAALVELENLNFIWLNEELKAASRYIEENEVIHLKTKKDIPTVIEYKGRRYVLDTKGGKKNV